MLDEAMAFSGTGGGGRPPVQRRNETSRSVAVWDGPPPEPHAGWDPALGWEALPATLSGKQCRAACSRGRLLSVRKGFSGGMRARF